MKLVGLDVETNSTDPKQAVVTEIGAILIEVSDGKIKELGRVNRLVYHEKYPSLSDEIVEVTGITDDLLRREGIPPRQAMDEALALFDQADACLAHNAEFDKSVLQNFLPKCERRLPEKLWACTINDVPYPGKYRCKKLSHLAFDHGMHVDVTKLHRAINDIELMFSLVLPRYPLDEILKRAASPWVYLAVDIPKPWEDPSGKELVGKHGWGWEKPKRMQDPPTFSKRWVKRVKEFELESEIEKVKPYPVSKIG